MRSLYVKLASAVIEAEASETRMAMPTAQKKACIDASVKAAGDAALAEAGHQLSAFAAISGENGKYGPKLVQFLAQEHPLDCLRNLLYSMTCAFASLTYQAQPASHQLTTISAVFARNGSKRAKLVNRTHLPVRRGAQLHEKPRAA